MRSGPGLYRVLILRVFNTNETMQCLHTVVDIQQRQVFYSTSCVSIDSEWDSHLLYSCWNIIQEKEQNEDNLPHRVLYTQMLSCRLHYYYLIIIIVVDVDENLLWWILIDDWSTRGSSLHSKLNMYRKEKYRYLLISIFFFFFFLNNMTYTLVCQDRLWWTESNMFPYIFEKWFSCVTFSFTRLSSIYTVGFFHGWQRALRAGDDGDSPSLSRRTPSHPQFYISLDCRNIKKRWVERI